MTRPPARGAEPPAGRAAPPPDPVPADDELSALRAGLRRQRARLWLRRSVRRAWWGLAIVAVAWAALLAVARLVPFEALPAFLVAAPAVVAVGLAVAIILARPSLGEAALALDAEAGLADRVGSALAFAAEPPHADGPDAAAHDAFVARQRRDALAALARVPSGTFRPRLARRPAVVAVVALTLLAPLALVPNGMDQEIARDRAVREEATRTAERIDRVAERLERQGRTPSDPRSRLAQDLRDLAKSLRDEPGALDRNLARLGAVEASVREQLDPSNEERAAALASLSRGLSRTATGNTRANPGGDPREAQQDVERLAGELDGKTTEELARLGQDLATLQGAAGEAGSGADAALRDATNALARGDASAAADALRRLGETLQGAEDRVATNRDLGGAASELQDARRRLADAGRPGDQIAGQPGQQGQQGQGQPGSSGDPGQGQGSGQGQGQGSGQGQGQGQGSGQGQGQGQGSGQGQGQGSGQGQGQGSGQGQGQGQGSLGGGGSNARYLGSGTGSGAARGPVNPNRPAGEPADQGSVYAPFDRVGRPGDPTYVAGTGGDGGQVQPGTGTGSGTANPALVPYTDVFGDFYRYAQTSLDRSYVPIAVKDFVRDYFAALDPTGQEAQ